MKTHFYILLMLGMVFLLGCEDDKLGTDLGVTNVVLPDISEESLGTEITIQGNGFIDCDVLALSPLSGGNSPSTWKPEKYPPTILRYYTPLLQTKILMDLY